MAASGSSERPYGWGWALTLTHELAILGRPDARAGPRRWSRWPPALTGTSCDWLPKATYSVRVGCTPTARSACPQRSPMLG